MSGARVALKSIPEKGVTVDGVVAVLPSDKTVITREKVAAGKTVLKGQAVVFTPGVQMTVEVSVANETRVFAGIAHSSGTMDTAMYDGTIEMISVVRGPIGRALQGEDLSAATFAKAGADGKFYVAADFATSHARIRKMAYAENFNGDAIVGADFEFNTIGK
jgi:hypothetical protein